MSSFSCTSQIKGSQKCRNRNAEGIYEKEILNSLFISRIEIEIVFFVSPVCLRETNQRTKLTETKAQVKYSLRGNKTLHIKVHVLCVIQMSL